MTLVALRGKLFAGLIVVGVVVGCGKGSGGSLSGNGEGMCVGDSHPFGEANAPLSQDQRKQVIQTIKTHNEGFLRFAPVLLNAKEPVNLLNDPLIPLIKG